MMNLTTGHQQDWIGPVLAGSLVSHRPFNFKPGLGGTQGYRKKTGSQKKKNKLIDIGLRWHSLDIEQSYWTVISGHWMVL